MLATDNSALTQCRTGMQGTCSAAGWCEGISEAAAVSDKCCTLASHTVTHALWMDNPHED